MGYCTTTGTDDWAKEHFVNTAHRGPAAEDSGADPTGMREVLGALPDPGPMPEHVAARIQESMARERAQGREGGWAGSTAMGGVGTAAAVADLSAERHRRRPAQWVMAAAAVVAVGVIGTVVFDQVLGSGPEASDVAAQYSTTRDDAAADDAGSDDAGSEDAVAEDLGAGESEAGAGSDSGKDGAEPEEEPAGDGVDQAGSVDGSKPRGPIQKVDNTTFASGAMLVLQDSGPPVSHLPTEFAGSPTPDRLSPASVRKCVHVVGEDPQDGLWAAAPATINGLDVVVLGDLTPDRSRAWAVSDDCPDDPNAEILNGPVSLP